MSSQPNVLLVCTDHWPSSLMGCAGHPAVETPTLDQIARNGTRFTNAYSECPVCIPARRTIMTGTTCRTHGDRVFNTTMPMPDAPTMAQTFRDAGYQANAVGKLHVYPQRDRIGFDDVILAEEGRQQWGVVDDHEMYLGDRGYTGQKFTHGMNNNDYMNRPWHLPEDLHPTNWLTSQMCRTIKRRDPTRPSFWYLSYNYPHPPLAPLQCYLDMYGDIDVGEPHFGDWSRAEPAPYAHRKIRDRFPPASPAQLRAARRAFYALCTHIDHQLRLVVGTLHEEGLLDNTILMFTSDHGDMLGNHGLWAKRLYYEDSANVPMLLMGTKGCERVGHHRVSDRIVGWQDVMPTLLDLAGIDVPDSVDGISMVGDATRDYLYGECSEDDSASRMIRKGAHKLIYYPVGNVTQLFNVDEDPREVNDLSDSPDHAGLREELTGLLICELYGSDEGWLQEGKLVGLSDKPFEPQAYHDLSLQRGHHWPVQSVSPPEKTHLAW